MQVITSFSRLVQDIYEFRNGILVKGQYLQMIPALLSTQQQQKSSV